MKQFFRTNYLTIGLVFYFFQCSVIAESQNNSKPYSNPVLIYGSSFGNYFQTLYKIGKYEEMIKFTSAESIKKFGNSAIMELYKKMSFGYTIKLKSKNENKDGSTTLNYETNIMATKGILRMNVKLENDSIKILLSSINTSNPF